MHNYQLPPIPSLLNRAQSVLCIINASSWCNLRRVYHTYLNLVHTMCATYYPRWLSRVFYNVSVILVRFLMLSHKYAAAIPWPVHVFIFHNGYASAPRFFHNYRAFRVWVWWTCFEHDTSIEALWNCLILMKSLKMYKWRSIPHSYVIQA